MNQQIQKPLLILNASAGSGKTYNLVYQFLKIVLKTDQSYQDFKHILAMTFTNKAANEMKERVIKALDDMASSTLQNTKKDAVSIFQKLEIDLQVDRDTLIQRAKKTLRSLLHSYEDFHVMTIDKFNLKLIRNFSRDLDLPGQFEIEMNTDQLIEKLVDNLLSKVGEKDLEELTELVFSYAKSNLEDGEKWNVKDVLVDFAKVLTKENAFPIVQKITSKSYDSSTFLDWNNQRKKLNKELSSKAFHVYSLTQELGMHADKVPNKGKCFNQLLKLKDIKTFRDGQPVTQSYAQKLLEEPQKGHFIPAEFQSALNEYLGYYEANVSEFNLLQLLVKNFHSMALLKFMSIFLEEIKQQEQIIQISEFNKLISSLIQQSHAPYIYERIGTKFNHYLLDEFQDTSRMQWLNLIPLVEESLANNHLNFIVGDPKQSIYRFRNGVAEQFVELPRIYNPEKSTDLEQKSNFFESQGKVIPLMDNRRSAQEIVRFNNSFFELLKTKLSPEYQKFYNPVSQIPTSQSTGYVSIISTKEKLDIESRIDKIEEFIKNCDDSGYKRSDICILGDKNKDLNTWAVELLKRNIPVVSTDSLFVNNDAKVRLTISYLKRRLNPKNTTEAKKFADLYFRMRSDKNQDDYWKYFVEKEENGKKIRFFNDADFIKENFAVSMSFFSQYETIYSLVQQFYRLMGWYEEKNPYLHHLADVIYSFEQQNSSDLRGFIDFYKNENHTMTVLLPESENSIKIMTVHKAKGLQFPVVIIPDMNFDCDIKNFSKYLIEVGDNIVYTNISKENPIKEINDLQEIEKNQILTDKINLCYVACTRPQERLYGINYFQKNNLGSIIHGVFQELEGSSGNPLISIIKGEENSNPIDLKNERQSDFFEPIVITDNLWFPDIAIRHDDLLNELSDEQKFGNAFHFVMANTNSAQELEEVLNKYILQDLIPEDFRNEILQKAQVFFRKLAEKNISETSSVILNEKSIIISEDTIKRPDKLILKSDETILIDFKTGIEKSRDEKQIREYALALKDMNLPKVKAFLFYTSNDELKEIAC